MAVKTPEQATANWVSSMSQQSTVDNYVNGVTNYQGNPMQMAAAAHEAWLEGCQRAAGPAGKFATRLARVPVERWKQNATRDNARKFREGVRDPAARERVLSHFARFQPFIAGVVRQIDQSNPRVAGDYVNNFERARLVMQAIINWSAGRPASQ